MKTKKGLFIAVGVVGIGTVLIASGMWLSSKMAKQPTPTQQVQHLQQVEKKPVKAEKAKQKVAEDKVPKPTTPAPTPATPVINVYCNCAPQVQTATPAPRAVSLSPRIPSLPQPAQTTGWWIVITDQTQSYTDSWGLRWVIDTNGDFYCPWVENPTGWVDGHLMWMFHPDYPKKGWYTKLAPGCYR